MDITFPSNEVTETIDAIRAAIGKDITIFITVSGIACSEPGCDLDPVTQLSTDQFCLTCNGDYWINTISGYPVLARVLYQGVGTPAWNPHGMLFHGDLQIRLKYTTANLDAVINSAHFEVDDRGYILKDYELRGVPEPNRIVVALVQKEG